MRRETGDGPAHYTFTGDEVAGLRADAELLHSMCLRAVDQVITTGRFADFGLPEWSWEAVAASWTRSDPHLVGRFDLRYDGTGPARLLEYDADVPTAVAEASLPQARWLRERHPGDGQWNGLHGKLVARWRTVAAALPGSALHVTWSAGDSSGRDRATAGDLQQTAAEAGLDAVGLAIEDLGWDEALRRFVDLAEAPIAALFKVYPWEWILGDDFGRYALDSLPETLWVEPLWKALLANKALLAVLWEMFPGHPNLLPAYLDEPGVLTEYVRKPRWGRDGANISVVAPGHEVATGGVYAEAGMGGGWVYQLFEPLPTFDGFRPALGVWMVGDEAVGLGIRETTGLVTDAEAAFVPHRVPR